MKLRSERAAPVLAAPEDRWTLAAVLSGAVVLDLVVWPVLAPFGQTPDTLLSVTVAMAMVGWGGPAVLAALTLGLLIDLSGGVLIGLGAASRALVVAGVAYAAPRAGVDRLGVAVAMADAAAVAAWGVAQLGAAAFGVDVYVTAAQVVQVLVHALLTGAVFAVAYALLNGVALRAQRRLPGRRRVTLP
ncbi:MAG: hypothetical protein IMX02_05480 [Limnochordaceae bacterium]|nr:hypothetical protein [Limnochordaceae bacterium]